MLSYLAIAVASYISGTQGFQLVKEQGENNIDFMIIRLWDYSVNTSMLRPVPIKGRKYFTPEVIEGLVDEVIGIDRQSHPERFKSAQVIQFKVKQRTDI